MPEEEKLGFFQRWSKTRRERKAFGKEFRDEFNDRSAQEMVQRHDPTVESQPFDAFVAADPDRGDDVAVGTMGDSGLQWSISWFPQTGEVIARAEEGMVVLGKADSEEAAHRALARSTTLEMMKDALYG